MSKTAGQLRVLVVDDEREVADAYALRSRGFCDVETAYSGPEALSVLGDEETLEQFEEIGRGN
ncbi:hypothetical protein [Halorhabdus sp. CBA1104]|jgi:CheY-like chemotaxis protein|uniref:hypothetical protein n=1 Tax=Halorhabdus sp. CBA1104 TaxID=1380432 RepID=UPI001E2EC084|nr:hypothetical protein [Halorhabdus sp. CBA1104]